MTSQLCTNGMTHQSNHSINIMPHIRKAPAHAFSTPMNTVMNTAMNTAMNNAMSSRTASTTTSGSVQLVPKCRAGKFLLEPDFQPNEDSVICGRGKMCSKASGNLRLKEIVKDFLQQYASARSKVEKTAIVSKIVTRARANHKNKDTAFIKKEDGRWWAVEESVAREKVGCILRDCLHTKYRSSTKSKLARRRAQKVCSVGSLQGASQVNPFNGSTPNAAFTRNAVSLENINTMRYSGVSINSMSSSMSSSFNNGPCRMPELFASSPSSSNSQFNSTHPPCNAGSSESQVLLQQLRQLQQQQKQLMDKQRQRQQFLQLQQGYQGHHPGSNFTMLPSTSCRSLVSDTTCTTSSSDSASLLSMLSSPSNVRVAHDHILGDASATNIPDMAPLSQSMHQVRNSSGCNLVPISPDATNSNSQLQSSLTHGNACSALGSIPINEQQPSHLFDTIDAACDVIGLGSSNNLSAQRAQGNVGSGTEGLPEDISNIFDD